MIADKIKFYTGLSMLALFSIVLILMFSPVFDGKNGMEYTDELYNSISKGSAYYIPDVHEESAEYVGTPLVVTIKMSSEEQAEQTALLYQEAGAEVTFSGVEIDINGDLGRVLETCLNDADAMYNNNGPTIADRYGYSEKQVLYNWWKSFGTLKKSLEDKGMFDEAEILSRANERAVEPAYNYYGIEAEAIRDKAGIVIFSLVFYIAYTIWYGFALMYILEGLGLKIRQMFPFSFVARMKLAE
ncbi:MAG: hypothetical protein JSW38_13835 [Dehalococcoidia bacterium]|nr:MAG: hypothetical protein JSV02_07145 [Dehalococcoidia bacterium]UCG83221.1 MAG: hypothetical protein JSW38_13835 [Dehalococcoidia bacterium]